jgi:hypothetical protein
VVSGSPCSRSWSAASLALLRLLGSSTCDRNRGWVGGWVGGWGGGGARKIGVFGETGVDLSILNR